MNNKKLLKFIIPPIIIAVLLLAAFLIQTNSGVIGQVKSAAEISDAGKLKIEFFDVGQGDAVLITTPSDKRILVDGGPDNGIISKLGESMPFYGRRLDEVILTHPHADHVAGLVQVLQRYDVGKVVMTGASHTADDYLEFLEVINDKGIPVSIIKDRHGEQLEDGLRIDYLFPDHDISGQKFENLNLSSIVFKLTYASTTALFTGDFEGEEMFVTSTKVRADVLKVGHHGSYNANDKDLLKAVSPRYAVMQVGADNSYGLPAYRTVYYLLQLGAKVFRTDEDGDVELISDGRDWWVAKPVRH